jgi:[acyl-carrier-protein] S-malonyltransferase
MEPSISNGSFTVSQLTLPDLTGGTAWVFAGQGASVQGMGQDIYNEFPQTCSIFESDAAGLDLKTLCFEASAEKLADTRYTQVAMAAFAAAVVEVLLDSDKRCDVTMGLSLGEYLALYVAGVFDLQTLFGLLDFRGEIMAKASDLPSRMVAVIGLSDVEVEEIVAEAAKSSGQVVSCTNYNSPGQVVIGGQEDAVACAEQMALVRGAKRCITLDTSGPFHTGLMKNAAVLLADRLKKTVFLPQRIPVVFNVTAAPASDHEIPGLLVRQIAAPVRFSQSIELLAGSGVTEIIEIGPKAQLAALIARVAPQIRVTTVKDAKSLREVCLT